MKNIQKSIKTYLSRKILIFLLWVVSNTKEFFRKRVYNFKRKSRN